MTRYALVWREAGSPERKHKPFRGGRDGAIRAAQNLMARSLRYPPMVDEVEVRLGGAVIYRTIAQDWVGWGR